MSVLHSMEVCRLCLIKDQVEVPIFGGEGESRQLFLKISACLPVKILVDDELPKNICLDCLARVEQLYEFCNSSYYAEKKLVAWLCVEKAKDQIEEKVGKSKTFRQAEAETPQRETDDQPNRFVAKKGQRRKLKLVPLDQLMEKSLPGEAAADLITGSARRKARKSDMERKTVWKQLRDAEFWPETKPEIRRVADFETRKEVAWNYLRETDAQTKTAKVRRNRNTETAQTCIAASVSEGKALETEAQCNDESRDLEGVSGQNEPALTEVTLLNQEGAESLTPQHAFELKVEVIEESAPKEMLDLLPLRLGEPTSAVLSPERDIKGFDSEDEIPLKNWLDTSALVTVNLMETPLKHENKPFAHKAHAKSLKIVKQEVKETQLIIRKECPECHKLFPFRQLPGHRKEAHGADIVCELCQQVCNSMASLRSHRATKHSGKDKVCEICGYTTKKAYDFRRHHAVHSQDFPIKCHLCSKGVFNNTELREHLNTHTQRRPYQCERCGADYSRRSTLTLHRSIKHPDAFDASKRCSICNTVCLTKKAMALHMVVHVEGRKVFHCDICGKGLLSGGTLRDHRRSHTGEKPYQCSYCQRAFGAKKNLTIHIKLHTGERNYPCRFCSKAYTKSSALNTHLKSHDKEIPWSIN